MTRDGDFKRLVRARMSRAGESYSTARARLRRRDELAVMTRRELEALPDAELVTRCAAPLSRRMHVAEPADRHAFLRRLTGAQGALLAFWILFAHAEGGLGGFTAAHPHRMVDDDFWTLLEAGLRRLGAGEMLSLTPRLRSEISRVLAAAGWSGGGAAGPDLDLASLERLVETLALLDPEVMGQLDDEYRRLLPGSLALAARLVRDHAGDFVSIGA